MSYRKGTPASSGYRTQESAVSASAGGYYNPPAQPAVCSSVDGVYNPPGQPAVCPSGGGYYNPPAEAAVCSSGDGYYSPPDQPGVCSSSGGYYNPPQWALQLVDVMNFYDKGYVSMLVVIQLFCYNKWISVLLCIF